MDTLWHSKILSRKIPSRVLEVSNADKNIDLWMWKMGWSIAKPWYSLYQVIWKIMFFICWTLLWVWNNKYLELGSMNIWVNLRLTHAVLTDTETNQNNMHWFAKSQTLPCKSSKWIPEKTRCKLVMFWNNFHMDEARIFLVNYLDISGVLLGETVLHWEFFRCVPTMGTSLV